MGTDPSSPKVVLVVDDETDVLRLVESILSSGDKVTVLCAKSADAGLKLYKSLADPPALVISDVVMPGMSGPMMVDQMLTHNPDQRVLFMSGYDDRHVVQRYVVGQGFQLVPKPFTAKTLRTSVQAALEKPAVARGSESQS